jgi:thiosulfate dehydrogenase
MKNFLIGLILGLLILPAGFYAYVKTGTVPVAASDPPMPFEKTLANDGLHARLKKEAPQKDLSSFTDADLVSGAQIYQTNCSFCHGLPGQPASAASQGMFPHAPQLFTADETVTDDPVGVTYWKVKNGIRLSGMPGFHAALGEQQMWQVSALMARADKLPQAALDALRPGTPGGQTATAPPTGQPAAAASH